MIAQPSSFCPPPPGIKGLNDLNGPSAWEGRGGKTAITSILKQEWCGSVACDLLSGIKILNILK